MFSEIPLSVLNDFAFCPRSIYFHGIYGALADCHYKAAPQKIGTAKHAASDAGTYSSRKRYRQGMEVSSERYGLVGKIDIYDEETKTLIERKTKVVRIYDGYKWQVLGQVVCLEEMGYEVREAILHSLSDNKKYPIDIVADDWEKFLDLLDRIRTFDISKTRPIDDRKKCAGCIYRTLCRGDVPEELSK